MMQHQHQHQQNQLQQQQQQHSNQTGSHMRTAQAAASQYPMGYPYPAGGMDNGQGLAQGQSMGGGEMQHFNMQQASAGGVNVAQRQMINVAQLNPMLAGDANGNVSQPGLPGGSAMDPNNALARGQLTARLGGVPMQPQAVLSQPPGGMMPMPAGMLANQQQPPMMMGGGMPVQQMAPGGQYPGNKE